MNDILFKFIIMIITLSIVIFLLIVRTNKIKRIYKLYVNEFIKTYKSLLIKKEDNYKLNEKEKIYIKDINDLIKISYELNKKIIYILDDDKCTFIIEDKYENIICTINKIDFNENN